MTKTENYASMLEAVLPKSTTKRCKCGCEDLVLLRSQNIKLCPDCKEEIHWPLTEGQKPLL